MTLENGRDVVRGVLLILFAATAYWIDLRTGVVLVAVLAVLIVQSAFSGWCPADVLLRGVGLRRRGEGGRAERGVRRPA